MFHIIWFVFVKFFFYWIIFTQENYMLVFDV